MNNFFSVNLFLLIAISLQFCGCSSPKTETLEDLGEAVFNTIKKGDYASLGKFMPNREDCEYFANLRDSTFKRATQKDSSINDCERYVKHEIKKLNNLDSISKSNPNLLYNGLGIDWKLATYKKIDTTRLNRKGYLYVIFACRDSLYRINLDGVVKSNRGWIFEEFEEIQFSGYANEEKNLCGGIKLGTYVSEDNNQAGVIISPQNGKYIVKLVEGNHSQEFLLACDSGVITGMADGTTLIFKKSGEDAITDGRGRRFKFMR